MIERCGGCRVRDKLNDQARAVRTGARTLFITACSLLEPNTWKETASRDIQVFDRNVDPDYR